MSTSTKKPSTEVSKQPAGKELLSAYMRDNTIADFTTIPFSTKLSLLQKTPPSFIKYRELKTKGGGVKIPYVTHTFAEKALNFVFNFEVSNRLISNNVSEVVKGNGKKCFEASCLMEFTFRTPEGKEITRTACGTHAAYENIATTKEDSLKSAMSKAWTVVARTFGIGADLNEKEEAAYRSVEQYQEPPQKTFQSSAPY